RFALPQAPKALTGVQNATSFGPACPQQELNPAIPVPTVNYTSISEACTSCSLVSRVSCVVSKPFAQVSSGGFAVGSPFDLDMRPTVEYSILLGEPVIIVAPNYRLNAFGFLSGKEASAAGITNLGMRDQIFALEWVQKYISAFGGDPDRVVLGGVSAGAISTGVLTQSNKQVSPTLFRGAFMLSGSPFPAPSQAGGQQYYDSLVAANNCTGQADTLECLRRVPYDAFLATVNQTPDIFSYQGLSFIWTPHVDGDVIVQNPVVSVSQGGFLEIPLMIGSDDDEGTLLALAQTNITTDAGFTDYLESVALPNATAAQISKVMELYSQDPAQGSPFGTGDANQLTPEFKRMAAFEGDLTLIGPRRFFLQHASSTQNTRSWLNKRGKSTPYLGASHTSDVPLFFPANISALTDDTGINALINFINTLDPNVSAAPTSLSKNASIFWPKWQTPSGAGSSSLLTFSDPLVMNITADDFRAEQIEYLNELNLNSVSS
ncbi:sterol esterase, partial [Mycena sanguinolenta]